MSESGKVVVTKSKLDGLANAINDKAKSPGPKTIAQLTQTVNDMKPDAPVTSVNGKTGDVNLLATDVSAIPSTLPGTVGQVLTKTADGQEWKDAAKELPNVTSVNGKTGDVILSATDVSAIPSTLTGTVGQVLTKTVDGQEWKDAASPQPSTTTPLAPTEAGSVGASVAYARGDHSHPKELPNVTTTDNGKFLRVVNGAWAAVEIANANGGSF